MTDIEITHAPAGTDTVSAPHTGTGTGIATGTHTGIGAGTPAAEPAPTEPESSASPEPTPALDIPADSPVVTVYSVFGMNCGHCANAVTRELSAIHGVTGVKVDLGAKKVTVGSTRPLSEDEVRAAVDEAGYEAGYELG